MSAPDWLEDARFHPGSGGDWLFTAQQEEAVAALTTTVIVPLAHLGAIRASGAEADSFLQNQLSNDIAALGAANAQLSSYNSPKGRVLDLFTLRRADGAVLLETRRDTLPATLKRLRMFVLRSKVTLDDLGERYAAFGLAGPQAAALLAQAGLPVPEQDWGVANAEDVAVLRRPGPAPRYSVHAAPERLAPLWKTLAAQAWPAGTAAWRLLDLLAGLPAIQPQTADHFVAQMLNLDRLGGISFTKGCYPGQEIVARMHYLGNLKRRMFLGFADAGDATAPGTSVHLAEGDGQAVGEVVATAPHPERGTALLAVLQLSHQAGIDLRLERPDGPAVSLERLAGGS
jgi:folate-binding protein YgfZ